MENKGKKIPTTILPIILCVLMGCVMIYTVKLRINASLIGKEIGSGIGTIVGNAIGSFEGMTKGRVDGTEAGKKAGLSAEDTEAQVANQIQRMEKLEVLVASVKLSDFHSIGEKQNYAALYLVNGNVVFTVDMSLAKVIKQAGSIKVILPLPKGELYLDDSSVNKVAEYQKRFFNGSAEDGFEAYLNTMKKIQEISEDTLVNYDELVDSARQAAENQVGNIIEMISLSQDEIVIEWAE